MTPFIFPNHPDIKYDNVHSALDYSENNELVISLRQPYRVYINLEGSYYPIDTYTDIMDDMDAVKIFRHKTDEYLKDKEKYAERLNELRKEWNDKNLYEPSELRKMEDL